ncbi:MAG: hypothetical protein AB7O21_17270 [Gammaproteobacteria bacterium]
MKRCRTFVAACLFVGATAAHAASTASATIDIGSLTVSGAGFTFGLIPATFFDSSANATDLVTTNSESLVGANALAMVNADTWATGSLVGDTLGAFTSASTFSATASSRFYKAFTITYDTDFGGTVTTTVDYTMSLSDGFAPNPAAPFADVFANVQLDVWAFDPIPSVSPYNDGDVFVGLAFFGGDLDNAGTLSTEITLPDLPAGTVLVFATESSIQVNAVGIAPVPVPPALALFASAAGLAVVRRRRHSPR